MAGMDKYNTPTTNAKNKRVKNEGTHDDDADDDEAGTEAGTEKGVGAGLLPSEAAAALLLPPPRLVGAAGAVCV